MKHHELIQIREKMVKDTEDTGLSLEDLAQDMVNMVNESLKNLKASYARTAHTHEEITGEKKRQRMMRSDIHQKDVQFEKIKKQKCCACCV